MIFASGLTDNLLSNLTRRKQNIGGVKSRDTHNESALENDLLGSKPASVVTTWSLKCGTAAEQRDFPTTTFVPEGQPFDRTNT